MVVPKHSYEMQTNNFPGDGTSNGFFSAEISVTIGDAVPQQWVPFTPCTGHINPTSIHVDCALRILVNSSNQQTHEWCIFLQQYRIHMDIGNSKNYLAISVIITITWG